MSNDAEPSGGLTCKGPDYCPTPVSCERYGRCSSQPTVLMLMVDAAMVEMKNISPPLRRSECERLIRAALSATGAAKDAPHGCHRSHPHEDMSEDCQRRTEELLSWKALPYLDPVGDGDAGNMGKM